MRDASKPLSNARHEAFARAIVQGHRLAPAYKLAGYTGKSRRLSWQLRHRPEVDARIGWMLADRVRAVHAAAARPEKMVADARERLIRELERIAYSDVRQVASWDARPQFDADGNLISVEETVRVVPSDELSRDAAASIKGVMTKAGRVQIETHDKLAALEKLAKILGMFKNDSAPPPPSITVNQVNVAGNALEAARRVGFLLASIAAGQAKEPTFIETALEGTSDEIACSRGSTDTKPWE